jgi:predicted RNA-binding Zn-ribbon protein involved in translation (DUF1610 family)
MRFEVTPCAKCGNQYANPWNQKCLGCTMEDECDTVCKSCGRPIIFDEAVHFGGRCESCNELEIGRLDALRQQWEGRK